MDPSIMKLLEEDEDETMHSGADVEAFTAALNRDMEGETSISQPSDSDSAPLSQGSGHTSSQFLPPRQISTSDENAKSLSQQDPMGIPKNEPLSDEVDVKHPGLVRENEKQQENSSQEVNLSSLQYKSSQDHSRPVQAEQKMVPISQAINMQDSENNMVHNQGTERTQNLDHEPQLRELQMANNLQGPMSASSSQQADATAVSNQQAMTAGASNQQDMAIASANQQASNSLMRGKQVPFALLLPVIQPQLDKDRAMQLNTLYNKLRKNEISKDGFVRHMRSIVGDQMLKMAVYKLQSQAARNTQSVPSQLPLQPQVSSQQQNLPTPSTVQMMMDPSNQAADSNVLKPREVEHLPDSHGVQLSQISTTSLSANQVKERSAFPPPGLNKLQPQHMHFSHASFPSYGNTGSIPRPYSATNANISASPLKQLPHDSQMRPVPAHQTMSAPQLETSTQGLNMLNSRVHSAEAPIGIGSSAKAPLKKPLVGQKKPMEVPGSSPPPSSKKQKVSGAFLDQSIEQLNDVTAVSGVNLREEEEQLFSGPKEDSRVSEASRRVVQEEEDRLILEKIPLQRKLVEIMAKSGLKGISNDVERCLSLCVEERMRGLIGNLIRLSKQRLDIEKPRHRTVITSDVRQQIMLINQKVREEWEKKQTEAEKLQRLNEPEGNPGVDGDKEKDEGRLKTTNKEEDDKMRTTAANVAARAAVGGDDMMSKWQLMAEQARQKREGGSDVASGSQSGKETGRKLSSARNSRDNQEASKKGNSATNSFSGTVRKAGRNQVVPQPSKVVRTISVKDVIAVLEREPQMSKSTLMYRLYEKVRSDAAAG